MADFDVTKLTADLSSTISDIYQTISIISSHGRTSEEIALLEAKCERELAALSQKFKQETTELQRVRDQKRQEIIERRRREDEEIRQRRLKEDEEIQEMHASEDVEMKERFEMECDKLEDQAETEIDKVEQAAKVNLSSAKTRLTELQRKREELNDLIDQHLLQVPEPNLLIKKRSRSTRTSSKSSGRSPSANSAVAVTEVPPMVPELPSAFHPAVRERSGSLANRSRNVSQSGPSTIVSTTESVQGSPSKASASLDPTPLDVSRNTAELSNAPKVTSAAPTVTSSPQRNQEHAGVRLTTPPITATDALVSPTKTTFPISPVRHVSPVISPAKVSLPATPAKPIEPLLSPSKITLPDTPAQSEHSSQAAPSPVKSERSMHDSDIHDLGIVPHLVPNRSRILSSSVPGHEHYDQGELGHDKIESNPATFSAEQNDRSASLTKHDGITSPIKQEAVVLPSKKEVTAPPTMQESVQSPSKQQVTASPIKQNHASLPSSQEDITSSTMQEATSSSFKQEGNASPRTQDVTDSPDYREVAVSPSKQGVISLPNIQDDILSLTKQEATALLIEQGGSASPRTKDATTLGAKEDSATLSPIKHADESMSPDKLSTPKSLRTIKVEHGGDSGEPKRYAEAGAVEPRLSSLLSPTKVKLPPTPTSSSAEGPQGCTKAFQDNGASDDEFVNAEDSFDAFGPETHAAKAPSADPQPDMLATKSMNRAERESPASPPTMASPEASHALPSSSQEPKESTVSDVVTGSDDRAVPASEAPVPKHVNFTPAKPAAEYNTPARQPIFVRHAVSDSPSPALASVTPVALAKAGSINDGRSSIGVGGLPRILDTPEVKLPVVLSASPPMSESESRPASTPSGSPTRMNMDSPAADFTWEAASNVEKHTESSKDAKQSVVGEEVKPDITTDVFSPKTENATATASTDKPAHALHDLDSVASHKVSNVHDEYAIKDSASDKAPSKPFHTEIALAPASITAAVDKVQETSHVNLQRKPVALGILAPMEPGTEAHDIPGHEPRASEAAATLAEHAGELTRSSSSSSQLSPFSVSSYSPQLVNAASSSPSSALKGDTAVSTASSRQPTKSTECCVSEPLSLLAGQAPATVEKDCKPRHVVEGELEGSIIEDYMDKDDAEQMQDDVTQNCKSSTVIVQAKSEPGFSMDDEHEYQTEGQVLVSRKPEASSLPGNQPLSSGEDDTDKEKQPLDTHHSHTKSLGTGSITEDAQRGGEKLAEVEGLMITDGLQHKKHTTEISIFKDSVVFPTWTPVEHQFVTQEPGTARWMRADDIVLWNFWVPTILRLVGPSPRQLVLPTSPAPPVSYYPWPAPTPTRASLMDGLATPKSIRALVSSSRRQSPADAKPRRSVSDSQVGNSGDVNASRTPASSIPAMIDELAQILRQQTPTRTRLRSHTMSPMVDPLSVESIASTKSYGTLRTSAPAVALRSTPPPLRARSQQWTPRSLNRKRLTIEVTPQLQYAGALENQEINADSDAIQDSAQSPVVLSAATRPPSPSPFDDVHVGPTAPLRRPPSMASLAVTDNSNVDRMNERYDDIYVGFDNYPATSAVTRVEASQAVPVNIPPRAALFNSPEYEGSRDHDEVEEKEHESRHQSKDKGKAIAVGQSNPPVFFYHHDTASSSDLSHISSRRGSVPNEPTSRVAVAGEGSVFQSPARQPVTTEVRERSTSDSESESEVEGYETVLSVVEYHPNGGDGSTKTDRAPLFGITGSQLHDNNDNTYDNAHYDNDEIDPFSGGEPGYYEQSHPMTTGSRMLEAPRMLETILEVASPIETPLIKSPAPEENFRWSQGETNTDSATEQGRQVVDDTPPHGRETQQQLAITPVSSNNDDFRTPMEPEELDFLPMATAFDTPLAPDVGDSYMSAKRLGELPPTRASRQSEANSVDVPTDAADELKKQDQHIDSETDEEIEPDDPILTIPRDVTNLSWTERPSSIPQLKRRSTLISTTSGDSIAPDLHSVQPTRASSASSVTLSMPTRIGDDSGSDPETEATPLLVSDDGGPSISNAAVARRTSNTFQKPVFLTRLAALGHDMDMGSAGATRTPRNSMAIGILPTPANSTGPAGPAASATPTPKSHLHRQQQHQQTPEGGRPSVGGTGSAGMMHGNHGANSPGTIFNRIRAMFEAPSSPSPSFPTETSGSRSVSGGSNSSTTTTITTGNGTGNGTGHGISSTPSPARAAIASGAPFSRKNAAGRPVSGSLAGNIRGLGLPGPNSSGYNGYSSNGGSGMY